MKRKIGGYGNQGKIRNDENSEKKNKQWLKVKDNVCHQILIQKSHDQRFPLEKEKKKKRKLTRFFKDGKESENGKLYNILECIPS